MNNLHGKTMSAEFINWVMSHELGNELGNKTKMPVALSPHLQ